MKRESGFTLVEIVVVIAIMGILASLAMPTFRTWQYRAYGTEATVMAKQILDAQIVYFLENEQFYPTSVPIDIYHDDVSNDPKVLAVKNNLNIDIPTGHLLNYSFTADNNPGAEFFQLTISSYRNFNIVKGSPAIIYVLYKDGKIENLTP